MGSYCYYRQSSSYALITQDENIWSQKVHWLYPRYQTSNLSNTVHCSLSHSFSWSQGELRLWLTGDTQHHKRLSHLISPAWENIQTQNSKYRLYLGHSLLYYSWSQQIVGQSTVSQIPPSLLVHNWDVRVRGTFLLGCSWVTFLCSIRYWGIRSSPVGCNFPGSPSPRCSEQLSLHGNPLPLVLS
jgi:hypothetical protein